MRKMTRVIVNILVLVVVTTGCAWPETALNERGEVNARLQAAVGKGDIKEITASLDSGADPNAADEDGCFPIHRAVNEDRQEVMALLVSRGADVKARTVVGETVLHLVKSANTAEFLISKGADVNAEDADFHMTPLFNADVEVASVLLSRGANIEATDREGHTPLAWSAYWNNMAKTRLLLSKGARVNAGAGKTKTALHIAANWGMIELAQLLLAHRADINARDESGWTPLHWAALEGGPEMVRFLIARGAVADARTLKPWSIYPAGSTIRDIQKGGGSPSLFQRTE